MEEIGIMDAREISKKTSSEADGSFCFIRGQLRHQFVIIFSGLPEHARSAQHFRAVLIEEGTGGCETFGIAQVGKAFAPFFPEVGAFGELVDGFESVRFKIGTPEQAG